MPIPVKISILMALYLLPGTQAIAATSFMQRHAPTCVAGATSLCTAKFLHTSVKSWRQQGKLPWRSKSYWANLLAVAGGVWTIYKLSADKLQAAINGGKFPLHAAIANSSVGEVAKMLQHQGIRAQINQPDAQGYTPFTQAIRYGRADLVKLLLETENITIDINRSIDGVSPLTWATDKYLPTRLPIFTEIVGLLFASARINQAAVREYIHQRVLSGSAADYALLAQLSGRCIGMQDAEGNTLLHMLTRNNYCDQRTLDLLSVLVAKSGDSINQKNGEGKTALHGAAISLNILAMNELLAHPKIDVNIQDNQGNTPVLFIIGIEGRVERRKEALNLLAAHGLNPYIANNNGKTAIHFVRRPEVLERLLSLPGYDTAAQRNLNAKDDNGNTALLQFCRHDWSLGLARILLKHGADPFVENTEGESVASVMQALKAKGDEQTEDERAMIAFYEEYVQKNREKYFKELSETVTASTPAGFSAPLGKLVASYLVGSDERPRAPADGAEHTEHKE